MLRALGVSRIALLSNNPDKAAQLRRLGVTVTERVPTGVHLSAANARYLATKARGARTRWTCRCQRVETSRSACSTVTASRRPLPVRPRRRL